MTYHWSKADFCLQICSNFITSSICGIHWTAPPSSPQGSSAHHQFLIQKWRMIRFSLIIDSFSTPLISPSHKLRHQHEEKKNELKTEQDGDILEWQETGDVLREKQRAGWGDFKSKNREEKESWVRVMGQRVFRGMS